MRTHNTNQIFFKALRFVNDLRQLFLLSLFSPSPKSTTCMFSTFGRSMYLPPSPELTLWSSLEGTSSDFSDEGGVVGCVFLSMMRGGGMEARAKEGAEGKPVGERGGGWGGDLPGERFNPAGRDCCVRVLNSAGEMPAPPLSLSPPSAPDGVCVGDTKSFLSSKIGLTLNDNRFAPLECDDNSSVVW